MAPGGLAPAAAAAQARSRGPRYHERRKEKRTEKEKKLFVILLFDNSIEFHRLDGNRMAKAYPSPHPMKFSNKKLHAETGEEWFPDRFVHSLLFRLLLSLPSRMY